jgi:hypothetical protein
VRIRALLLLPALVAAPLSAQMRLPKPKLPTVGGTTRAATRVPTYDDRVIEITDARLTALVRGLAAEQGKVRALETLERGRQDAAAAEAVEERREAERKPVDPAARERVQRCFEASPEYRAYMAPAETAKRDAAMQRATRASEQRKYDEMTRISDSLTAATNAWEATMRPVARRCGATDEMMREWDEDDAPAGRPEGMEPEDEEISVRDSLMAVGAVTSGMTEEQYGVMRERVLAFLNASPDELNQSAYIYSALELRALQGKRSQLSPYMELLTEY